MLGRRSKVQAGDPLFQEVRQWRTRNVLGAALA
jgi:hypothetical protein